MSIDIIIPPTLYALEVTVTYSNPSDLATSDTAIVLDPDLKEWLSDCSGVYEIGVTEGWRGVILFEHHIDAVNFKLAWG